MQGNQSDPTSTQYSGGRQNNRTPSNEIKEHPAEIGGIHTSDPFEIPKPGLLISKRHVNGNAASFLFDTGCTANVISPGLCQNLGITYKLREDYESTMANETVQKIGEEIGPAAVYLGSYTECMRFIVSRLKCNVILRKKLETKYKAKIDCENNQICFKHQGRDHVLHACNIIEKTSLGSLINDYKKGFPIYSALLRNPVASNSQCSPARDASITEILPE